LKNSDVLTSLLIALKQGQEGSGRLHLSDNELYGNMFVFLLAGHETTANTLEYALALCAANPEIQEKVYQEIIAVIGHRIPEYEDFSTLVYPMYVMKETLRLFPPVTSLPKSPPKDTTLQVPLKKYQNSSSSSSSIIDNSTISLKIHAGTIINVDIAALHRNPKFWPHPDQFYPQRFDPKSELQNTLFMHQNPHNNPNVYKDQKESGDHLPYYRQALIPFSDGVRSCLGKKFAEVEFVCALSSIIQRFTVHLPSDVNKDTLLDSHSILTLKPKKSVHLLFRKRHN